MSGSIMERGIEAANRLIANGITPLSLEHGIRKASELLDRSELAMVGSVRDDGYPNIKSMFKIKSENLRHVWFSTNTSSKRVAQFKKDPKACVYVLDAQVFAGLMLTGTMEPVFDAEIRQRLWHTGWEAYYPQGVSDPDYCILKFTAKEGNFYQGLQNVCFQL
ncbi:pyridoxamine 5'-phosphate oxidase family protein [Paenibacillus tarimensis]